MAPESRTINLSIDFDAVQVFWVGSSSSGGMSGTIEVNKGALRDPKLIEWLENRELYDMWE